MWDVAKNQVRQREREREGVAAAARCAQSRHDQVTEEAATTTILSAEWNSSCLLDSFHATIAAISTYVKLGN